MRKYRLLFILAGTVNALIIAGIYASDCYLAQSSFAIMVVLYCLGALLAAWGATLYAQSTWQKVSVAVAVIGVTLVLALLAFGMGFNKCFQF